ncbi:hypothetical protein ACXO6H_04165 [Lactobacillus delbrueckii subsp. bulgaricus]
MIVKPKSWPYLVSIVIILALLIITQAPTVNVLIILNCLIGIVTVLSAKVSLLSLWSLVSNYTYLNVVHYYFASNGYGLLALTDKSSLHILEMSKYLLILNLSLLFWSMFTMFSSREDDLLKTYSFEALEKNNSRQFINFACLVAIACSIIEFPRLPFTSVSSAARFATLLPGTGWNHLALIAMLFLLPSLKHSKQVKWTYIFVIFWFLSHGERVDMIGFLILLLFLYLKNHKITISTLIKSIVVALIIFLVFSYIGERRGGADNITLGSLFEKLFKQNTASDVGYVFNISCDYIKKYPLTHGKLLIFYLEQIIPDLAIPSVQNCGDIFLGARYAYPGGAYILTEPLLDFGVLGVLIIPNVYLGLIYMFLKNKRQYKFYVYIFLGATVLRYVWYGMEYIETALVWFIPFFYYLYHKRVKVKFS